IAGEFTSVDGKEFPYVARLKTDGVLDEEWGGAAVGINGAVFDVGIRSDGKVIIGGEFTEISGYSRNSYARLHHNGELDRNFDPGEGANGPVFAVALQPDGNILLGGQFTQVGEYEQNNITRIFGGEQFALGRVEFRSQRIEYDEGATNYEVKVIRSGKVQEPVTVQYKTVDGTAKEGEDFTAVTGDIHFDKGQREALISISLLDDTLAEGAETFTIELTSDAVGVDLGGRISLVVVVIDNESSASLERLAYEVLESDGEIVLFVSRFGGLGEASTVNYTVNGITASADEDYSVAKAGLLTFEAGADKTSVSIKIVNDLIEEPKEQLSVTLSGTSEGLTLVGELTATIVLLDDDQPVSGLTTFELGVIPSDSGWSSFGNNTWYAQADQVYEGSYALRSGKITDAQESILVLERETGSGTGSFELKVSSEKDWDYLDLCLNCRFLGKMSGRGGWSQVC
ncbi:MAG: Calx-beta domain-containing protein, partial [Verrucomicrobiota bacterium]|nr:Calx-beta domain-containing protein [Verrucomicrobiota bacterium]